jgi:hypothetical protein
MEKVKSFEEFTNEEWEWTSTSTANLSKSKPKKGDEPEKKPKHNTGSVFDDLEANQSKKPVKKKKKNVVGKRQSFSCGQVGKRQSFSCGQSPSC